MRTWKSYWNNIAACLICVVRWKVAQRLKNGIYLWRVIYGTKTAWTRFVESDFLLTSHPRHNKYVEALLVRKSSISFLWAVTLALFLVESYLLFSDWLKCCFEFIWCFFFFSSCWFNSIGNVEISNGVE